MKFFEKYVSNTTAGSTSQRLFKSDGKPHVGRVFYKICCNSRRGRTSRRPQDGFSA